MMKKCIIFDNEDQTDEIEKLIRDGRNSGIEIECEQFNVGSTFFTEVLSAGKIDIDKVIIEYKKRFKGKTFQLAAFDWDLDDDKINGIELLRKLKANRILKNTPKIIYSGLLDEILAGIEDLTKTDRINRIKTLINNDIRGYHERGNRDIEIIHFFSNELETLDLILEEELKKFPDLVFENRFVNKNFNGKTFLEIIDFLEHDDKIHNDFKKEIIQQVIAYLTEKI